MQTRVHLDDHIIFKRDNFLSHPPSPNSPFRGGITTVLVLRYINDFLVGFLSNVDNASSPISSTFVMSHLSLLRFLNLPLRLVISYINLTVISFHLLCISFFLHCRNSADNCSSHPAPSTLIQGCFGMLLTEECAHVQVPRSPTERQKFIAAQEKMWMSLSWDRKRYTADQAKTALTLLSAIAFSDHRDPIDPSHLSDDGTSSRGGGSSADGGSSSQRESQRESARHFGIKRPADMVAQSSSQRPPKKSKRSAPIPNGTQVACLDKSSGEMWVLGRIVKYMSEIKRYEVLDHDGEEQRYRVTRQFLRVIPKRAQSLDPEKPILAVYPRTTVFYKARLIARRGKNWAVEFDDEDDTDSNKIKEVDGRFILQDCL